MHAVLKPVQAEFRRLQRELDRACVLLKRAQDDLYDELYSAGPDEVKQHPTLASHQRTHDAIERFLRVQALRKTP